MNHNDYIEAEHRIFGIHKIIKGACGCGDPDCKAIGKNPVASNWQHSQVWSEEQLDTMELMGHFDTGFGVLVSGLLIVDVDARNGGVDSFNELCKSLGIDLLGDCSFAVKTGSGNGSMHLYFKAPVDVSMRQSHDDFKGIDFKSSGYVVGCGSLHASGQEYELIHGSPDDIQDAPPALIELLKKPEYYRAQSGNDYVDINQADLALMLSFISADCEYDDWIKIGMALNHIDAGFVDLWDSWSRDGRKYCGYDIIQKHWHSFGKCGNPVTVGSIIHLARAGGYIHHEYEEAKAPKEPTRLKGGVEPIPFNFKSFALNGNSKEMRQKMLDDKFVLNGIAILGQATALYAKPNSGKTLLTIYLVCEGIKSGELNADDVFYVNADDNYKGLVTKLEIAEKYGFNMVAPGYYDFNVNEFADYMTAMVKGDQCQGKVIILDTLKKFTNIMDKKLSSDFGKVMRSFVSKGGTMILLAHTNKNRDNDGKVVFSGTSDIVDDVDCAYTIDVSDNSDGSIKTVVFENIKSRGDVEQNIAFNYLNKVTVEGGGYLALLDSVTRISEKEAQQARTQIEIEEKLEKNMNIIEAIQEALEGGEIGKTDLIESAHQLSGVSKERVTKTLNTHSGKDWSKGHRWTKRKGEKHSYFYRLITDNRNDTLSYQEAKEGY